MNDRLDRLLSQIRELEKEVVRETKNKEAEFCYKVTEKTVQFTEEARARHKWLVLSVHRYVLDSRFFVIATTPVIWMCIIPIVLTDAIGSFYQAICFPIYGIPKVVRRDYLSFDRRHLAYLNIFEKLNCLYCAYVNGVLAYMTEMAARTEQYWCPIKHAQCVKCAHSRYKNFFDYGDAEQYRQHIEEIRRSFQDIKSKEADAKKV
jgi:hypothetical protein